MTVPIPSHQIILDFPGKGQGINKHLSISALGSAVTYLGKIQDCTTSPAAKNFHFCILLPEN